MNETSANYVLVNDLKRLLRDDDTITLIDARTSEEYAAGHVPGAINVGITELQEFAERRDKVAKGLVVTMCGSTGRGEKAAQILYSRGVANTLVLQGGLKAWKDSGLPIATV